MGVQLARKLGKTLWWLVRVCAWCLLGLWTALALFFTIPLPFWLATVLAVGVSLLYLGALPERFYVPGRTGFQWRLVRRSIAALVSTALVAVWFFGFVTPKPEEDWLPPTCADAPCGNRWRQGPRKQCSRFHLADGDRFHAALPGSSL